MTDEILNIKNLQVCFPSKKGNKIAVNGVNLSIKRGEIFGLVGESGCGKSVTSMAILRLISKPGKITGGEILLNGENVLTLTEKEMQHNVRGTEVSMIFQEPMTSLNPLIKVGEQIAETMRVHKGLSKEEAKEEAIKQISKVGIPAPERCYDSYPYSMSGGMRQRIMIAIAMACNPQLLIADEPTTALDVTIQAQILDLMKMVRNNTGTSILMITHDLGVVSNICDRVAVMYCGKIVEQGKTQDILNAPCHPYTKGLIASIPKINAPSGELYNIRGTVPQIYENDKGCHFASRCSHCMEKCYTDTPPLTEIHEGHAVACHMFGEKNEQ